MNTRAQQTSVGAKVSCVSFLCYSSPAEIFASFVLFSFRLESAHRCIPFRIPCLVSLMLDFTFETWAVNSCHTNSLQFLNSFPHRSRTGCSQNARCKFQRQHCDLFPATCPPDSSLVHLLPICLCLSKYQISLEMQTKDVLYSSSGSQQRPKSQHFFMAVFQVRNNSAMSYTCLCVLKSSPL